jgi:hypothetical protein
MSTTTTIIHAGDQIRVKATGEILTIQANLGPKWHPPLTVREDDRMFSLSEVERIDDDTPPAETMREQELQPTALPWALRSSGLIVGNVNGNVRFIARLEHTDEQGWEDGKFMLTAIKSHTALVEALRLVVMRYDITRDIYWRQLGLPRPQDDDDDTIRTARKALHDAEQQTQKET